MNAQQWQFAESLFHAALDLPVDARANWVVAACPGDPRLADAVIRMLEADAHPGDEIRLAVRSAVKQWLTK